MTDRKPTHAWRNHYTPQFYLRRWVSGADQRLWQYKRTPRATIEADRVTPKQTSFRRDLYTFDDAGPSLPAGERDVIEKKVMGAIDSAAAPALEKLVTSGPDALTPAERRDWATFLNSLLERNPEILDSHDAIAKRLAGELMDQYLSAQATPEARARMERALRFFDHVVLARNTVRVAMLKDLAATDFVDFVAGRPWHVIDAPAGLELITGDRPLLVNVGEEPQRPIHAMTIALTPTKLFAFASFPTELTPGVLAQLPIAHTVALVVRSASEFLYSLNEIRDGAHVGTSVINVRTMMDRAWRVA